MTAEEKILKEATLVYLIKDGNILLPKKSRKIGAGRRNGYGGGLEEGEGIRQSALRELKEESGVVGFDDGMEKVAELYFKNKTSDGVFWEILVHVFLVRSFEGVARETEDGAMIDPKWFAFDEIPFEEMMEADREWLPKVLAGKKIRVRTYYGPFQKELLAPIEIEEVADFGE